MLIALWIVNGLLALLFLTAGSMKMARARDAIIAGGMGWAEDYSGPQVKAIGAIEVIGAFGLVLPLATGIATILAPLAALGLTMTMIAAIVVHIRRKEGSTPSIVLAIASLASTALGFLVVLG